MGLDEMVDQAWRAFRSALADGLERLPGDRLTIQLGDDARAEGSPYVAFAKHGDSVLVLVPGNRRLAEEHRLGSDQKRRLRHLGLRKDAAFPPGTRGAVYRAHQVEEMASVATSALREAYGVLHPTFLVGDEMGWRPDVEREEAPAPGRLGAVYTHDHQHLDALVEAAVEAVVEHPPVRDDDDDLAVVTGTSVVYVHTARREPLIRIFSVMVIGLTDVEAAEREVAALNREVDGVKFERRDEQIIASMDLVAFPFAAEHLQMLLAHVCDVVTSRDHEIAERVGGRVFLDRRNFEDDTDQGPSGDEPVDPESVWGWENPPN